MGEKTKDNNKTACTAMRRIASSNLQLYTQADKKAQMLIQVNALMISVLLVAAMQLSAIHRLAIIPVTGQLFFSAVVIMLSLRSTRPAAPLPRHSVDRTGVLLQFSEYDQMQKDEYMTDMKDMLDDSDRLFAILTQNIYFQSQVLGHKYRYLNWAFIVFIGGLVITVLTAIGIAIH